MDREEEQEEGGWERGKRGRWVMDVREKEGRNDRWKRRRILGGGGENGIQAIHPFTMSRSYRDSSHPIS